LRGKIKAMITMKNKKKDEEKSKVRKEVKILKNLAEDFDPELYIKEKEEEEDNISYENEEVSDE
jgi:predicted Ser/Thr protein kinase